MLIHFSGGIQEFQCVVEEYGVITAFEGADCTEQSVRGPELSDDGGLSGCQDSVFAPFPDSVGELDLLAQSVRFTCSSD